MEKCKHCVKCDAFAWWDGDFCCTKRMSIIEGAEDGKFWAILPKAFDANECEDYNERENYDTEVHDYYGQYIKFLHTLINDTDNYFSDEYLLSKYGYKDYKNDVGSKR